MMEASGLQEANGRQRGLGQPTPARDEDRAASQRLENPEMHG